MSAWVQVLRAKASASAAEVLSTGQVSERVSAGGRAALWRAAPSVSVSVVSGALVSASAGERVALWQVGWCHWPEADWYREGLASLEPVDLVLPLAAWLNLAVSALA